MLSTQFSDRSIFLVEDDLNIRDTLTQVLLCEGYEIHSASSGLEALTYLRASEAPSLILLDLALTNIEGWEYMEKIKRIPKLTNVPIVIISGDVSNRSKALCKGAAAYLTKPLDIDLLLDTLCLITSTTSARV